MLENFKELYKNGKKLAHYFFLNGAWRERGICAAKTKSLFHFKLKVKARWFVGERGIFGSK